jgi:hypothetical protein
LLFISLSVLCTVLAIFAYPLMWFTDADGARELLQSGSSITFFGLGPVVMVAAVASDIQRQDERP